METHSKDPSLEDDVNAYIWGCIVSYGSNSYHAYLETVETFKQPHVVTLFKRYNVTLDLDWSTKDILYATKDTQEYAKTLCLKKAINTEIKSLREETLEPKYEIDSEARSLLASQIYSAKNQLDSSIDKSGLFKGTHLHKKSIHKITSNALTVLNELDKELKSASNDKIFGINKKFIRVIQNLHADNLKIHYFRKKEGKLGEIIHQILSTSEKNTAHIASLEKENTLLKKLAKHR